MDFNRIRPAANRPIRSPHGAAQAFREMNNGFKRRPKDLTRTRSVTAGKSNPLLSFLHNCFDATVPIDQDSHRFSMLRCQAKALFGKIWRPFYAAQRITGKTSLEEVSRFF